jgi:hypothetical protein
VVKRERGALWKLPHPWKKQNAMLLFPPMLGKVQNNFSTATHSAGGGKFNESNALHFLG